jgi:hypothetical protein
MELRTIEVNGIEFDVFYEFSSESDPLGTGDSPTAYYLELKSIELTGDTVDLTEVLANGVIESIHNQIYNLERN